MKESQFVDLFSNASLALHPDNRVSTFTVSLDHPLVLEGPYEVSLAHLITPSLVKEFVKGQIIISTFPETRDEKRFGKRKSKIIKPEDEFYPEKKSPSFSHKYQPAEPYLATQPYSFTINLEQKFEKAVDLVIYLRDLFKTKQHLMNDSVLENLLKRRTLTTGQKIPIKFDLSNSNTALKVYIRDPDIEVAISGSLARVLGIPASENQWTILTGPGEYTFSQYSMDLDAVKPSLMSVYCDAILPLWVGDSMAPLLRTCVIPRTTQPLGTFIDYQFEVLQYLKVVRSYIQDITVEFRANDGSLMPFEAGVAYLRLHFRPISQT